MIRERVDPTLQCGWRLLVFHVVSHETDEKYLIFRGLKFLGTVNRAILFQYSELTGIFVARSESKWLMLMRQIL